MTYRMPFRESISPSLSMSESKRPSLKFLMINSKSTRNPKKASEHKQRSISTQIMASSHIWAKQAALRKRKRSSKRSSRRNLKTRRKITKRH